MGNFQRYHPGKKRTLCHIAIIWVISAFFAAPTAVLYEFKYIPNPYVGYKPYCSTHNPKWKLAKFKVG